MASQEPFETGRVLGDAGARTGVVLSLLGDRFYDELRDALAAHGLTPRQLRVLDLLADRGPQVQSEMAALMGIEERVLVDELRPLETKALISRRRDSADRRWFVVSIVTPGRRRLAEADRAFRRVEDTFLGTLAPDERRQLRALLLRVQASTGAAAHDP